MCICNGACWMGVVVQGRWGLVVRGAQLCFWHR